MHLLDQARAKAIAGNQPVRVTDATARLDFVDKADVIPGYGDWFALPTGLVLASHHVNWFWYVPGEGVRQGSRAQADRYARAVRIDPADITSVPPDLVHGGLVRDEDPNAYRRFYYPRSFPAWTEDYRR